MKKVNKHKLFYFIRVLIIVVLLAGIAYTYISIINDRKVNNGDIPENPDGEHVHVFNVEKEEEKYLVSNGNCQLESKYYYSCLCGEKNTEIFIGSKDMTRHVNIDDPSYSNPTNEGHTVTKKCILCNTIVIETTEKHAYINELCVCGQIEHVHTFNQERMGSSYLASSPTCKEPSKYYYSCACGVIGTETFEYGETISHTYEPSDVKHSACEETGLTKYTCKVCGDSYDQTIPTYGHMNVKNPIEKYKANDATCVSKAKYYYVCSACGEKSTDTYEAGELSTKHQIPYEVSYTKLSTSEHTKIEQCTLCNEKIINNELHNEVNGTCDKCGNHNHVFINTKTDATFFKNGATCLEKETYYKSCPCGIASTTETFTIGNFGNHNYIEKVVIGYLVSEATCENKAVYYKSCSVCNIQSNIIFEYGSALGHIKTTTLGYDATCTTDGKTETVYCERCQQIVLQSTVIPAIGHIEAIDPSVNATCNENGLTEGSHCLTCGKVIKKQEIIPAEHLDNNNDGTCDRCNNTF